MRFAIAVQSGSLWVVSKPDGAVLVRDTRQGNSLSHEKIAREQALMAIVAVNVALGLFQHQLFQFCCKPLMAFVVIGRIAEDNVAFAVQRDAVFRIGQVFGSEPEVKRMVGHQVERETRRDGRSARTQSYAIQLADKRD